MAHCLWVNEKKQKLYWGSNEAIKFNTKTKYIKFSRKKIEPEEEIIQMDSSDTYSDASSNDTTILSDYSDYT